MKFVSVNLSITLQLLCDIWRSAPMLLPMFSIQIQGGKLEHQNDAMLAPLLFRLNRTTHVGGRMGHAKISGVRVTQSGV